MADILIRGMEMPTEQRIEVLIFKNGFVAYYDVEGRYIGQAKAVPIPEGHGELIDKQAFIADIAGFIECMSNVGVLVDGETLWGKLLDALANAKTIVPAEGGADDGN